ncbi:CLUMA_CG014278, isoform B [Clunio marinus]|uniref:CLUMA_CG014278, isoform B n=1 Tax=Clunio marinus TaxID=568069 RepID=A0A1J1IP07_9DIPT|nr:CLUMA_CG014278, isoform B [Clunio marinus]
MRVHKLKSIFHLISFEMYVFCIYYDLVVLGWKVFDPFDHMKPYAIPLKGRLMFLTTWNLFFESRVFSAILHCIAIGQLFYAMHFDMNLNIPDTPGVPKMLRHGYGGRSRFLTYWCLILQSGYFIIALLNDFVGSNEVAPKKTPFIRRVKDYIFAALAFPVAFNVGVTFWSLYAVDRELVFPKALDAFFPNWLNHIMHTNIMIFIIMELFTSFRNYPSRKAGFTGLGIFMASYLIWIHVIKHKANIWVYPVLEVLNLPQRIVFFILCLAFSVGLYLLGEFSNQQVWVKEIKHAQKNIFVMIFHLAVSLHYMYAIYYDWVYVLPKEIVLREYSFGGKLVYLTVLNVILQALYFFISFINDLIGSNEVGMKDRPFIRKLKDYFFSSFAFPLALDVSILFWSLYAIDRQTVFPKEVDSFFPSWLNHILHTNIAIFIIIELIAFHREYPTRKEGISGLLIFLFAYLAWIHITKYFAGRFPYPIVEILDIPGRIAFFSFAMQNIFTEYLFHSVMSTSATLFHLVAVVHFYFGIYYDITYVTEPEVKFRKYEFGGRLVYLTILSFIIHGIYFTIALLNDLIGSNEPTARDQPLIRRVRDYIFTAFSFPLAFDVGGMFWLLYGIDRKLVLPKEADEFFPPWLNHVMHTNIMIFMLIEMILLYHKYPSRKSVRLGMGTFMIGYLGWVHIIKYKSNFWVYPVLAVLNWPQRIGFYIFTLAVPVVFYFVGEFLNRLIWPKSRIGETITKKSNYFVKIFHFLAAIQFLYGIYYECVHVLPEDVKLRKFSFGGKFIYLTFLNGIIHAVYHSIALVHDFMKSEEIFYPVNPSRIRKFRDYMFATFAFPLGMNVAFVFWLLYSIDRELVFPSAMDAFYPWWLNHILHTNVFVFIVVELIISYHHYSNRKAELGGLSVFIAGYLVWVLIIKYNADAWVYPVLDVLDLYQRIGFFIVTGSLPLLFYFIGNFINDKVWKIKHRLNPENDENN